MKGSIIKDGKKEMKTMQPLLYEIDFEIPLEVPKQRLKRKVYNQYFTPKDIVYLSLSLIYKEKPKNIVDPAVGEGVFLNEAEVLWPDAEFWGIDIDQKLIEDHIKIEKPKHSYLVGDSLQDEVFQHQPLKNIMEKQGGFDLVVGNPPFSSWFNRVSSSEILKKYDLGQKDDGKIVSSQAIEILFIERFIRLVKKGGAIVIVLPNGILSNPQHQNIREYILSHCIINYIINVPRGFFTGTQAKTAILIMTKKQKKVSVNYEVPLMNVEKNNDHYKTEKVLVNNFRLMERMDYLFYHPDINNKINKILKNNLNIKMKDIVEEIFTGSTAYGKDRFFAEKGDLKFLSPKNIAITGVDFYRDLKFVIPGSRMDHEKAHAKINDFLFTRVGVGCIGRVAVVSREKDIGVVNDYIFIIRLKEIDPFYLFLLFKSEYGRMLIEKYKQHGAGTASISQKSVLEFPIPLANLGLMTEFTQKVLKKVTQIHNKAVDYREAGEESEYRKYLKICELNLQNIIVEFNKIFSRG